MTDQFDPSKPCRTRDGREAEIFATDCLGSYPIVGRIKGLNGWEVFTWSHDGHTVGGQVHRNAPSDLVNVTPDVVRYAGLYSNGQVGGSHKSREQLDHYQVGGVLAVLKITIRDGRDVSVEVERV